MKTLLGFVLLCAGCARGELPNTDVDVAPAAPDDAGPPETEADAGSEPRDAALPAPSPEDDEAACAVLEAEDTLARVPVDIVWAIDDSLSMLDERARIRENIAAFAEGITQAGIDVRVVFITEDDLAEGTALFGQPSYLYVDEGVGSDEGLAVLLDAFPRYSGHLRAEARTHFVAVTDDDSDLAPGAFRTQMEATLGRGFTFHAIASESLAGRACPGAAAPGDAYFTLAAETGGQSVSICTLDWGTVFDTLEAAVVSGSPLPCRFELPEPPDGADLDPDRVRFEFVDAAGNVRELPRALRECGILTAWQYDDAQRPSAIELCPQACASLTAGGSVRIALGCEPVVVQ